MAGALIGRLSVLRLVIVGMSVIEMIIAGMSVVAHRAVSLDPGVLRSASVSEPGAGHRKLLPAVTS